MIFGKDDSQPVLQFVFGEFHALLRRSKRHDQGEKERYEKGSG
jgi:hypothetical protein